MFKHSDAGDLVELLFKFQVAIVANLDTAAVVQPKIANTLPGHFGLPHIERNPKNLDSVLRRRMDQPPSPSATDVEHAIART